MVTDKIGDLIIRLKNASMAGRTEISVPHSALRLAILKKLEQKGYIKTFSKRGKKVKRTIDVELSYEKKGQPKIAGVERISKPGKRVYQGTYDIRPVKYGKGSLILSTSRGILTDEEARKEKIGGEALFKIW